MRTCVTANGQSSDHAPADDDLVELNTTRLATLDWIMFSYNSLDRAILQMIGTGLAAMRLAEIAAGAGIEGATLISPAGDDPAEVAAGSSPASSFANCGGVGR